MSSIVVADAGPLHYLILVDCANVLENLFDRVLIPGAVRDELLRDGAPEKVKEWMRNPKTWLAVQLLVEVHPIHGLHRGETEALQLALKRGVDG